MFKKIKYAISTVKDVITGVINGNSVFVSEKEKNRRMTICKDCEHYTELCGTARCNECGCFAMLKTELASAKCPCGKW